LLIFFPSGQSSAVFSLEPLKNMCHMNILGGGGGGGRGGRRVGLTTLRP